MTMISLPQFLVRLFIGCIVVTSPFVAGKVRIATFNASLNRNNDGTFITDISAYNASTQAAIIAEIIQRNNPDILLINEFDYDPRATSLYQQNYLSVSRNGQTIPINFPYSYIAPSNTGIPSGFDLDNNNVTGGPNDAYGFGFFAG
jgi:hypothetical protein